MSDLHDMTESELERLYEQTRYAQLLADLMSLGGAKAGAGDVYHALRLAGMELRPAGDDPVANIGDLLDVRDCPKCGAPQARRTDGHNAGWWHERGTWGFERRCS